MRSRRVFEQLLVGWKAQGWTLGSTRSALETLQPMALPRCEVGPGTVEGRSGTLLVQGARVPGRRRPRAGGVTSRAQRRSFATSSTNWRFRMLGKKVADFSAPATGEATFSCPPTRATRSSSISIRRTTRRAARPKARTSATSTSSSRSSARSLPAFARHAQIARRLQGEDGLSRSSSSRMPTRSSARSSTSSR